MALITNIIPLQSFELIRERIAIIIKSELSAQVLMTYDTRLDASVLIESFNPNDQAELPVINISFAASNYDNKNYHGSKRGNPYTYNVDVYTKGHTDNTAEGYYNSAVLLQRLIAIIGYVLDNPIYKTLGFVTPMIERVYISEINIANKNKEDANNTSMGRITFNVVAVETTQLLPPVNIAGWDTTVKLTEEQGYFWTGNS